MWELFIGDLREVVAPSLEDDWRVNEELMVCILGMHHLDNVLGGVVVRAGKAIDLVHPFQHIQLVIKVIVVSCLSYCYCH